MSIARTVNLPLAHTVALAAALLLALPASGAKAFDEFDVPQRKTTTLGLYLLSIDAERIVREAPSRVLFVDVRSESEVTFIGMPESADANVPFMTLAMPLAWDENRRALGMVANADFVQQVTARLNQKQLTKADRVILICRSGDRSARAADTLAAAGFTKVYSVVDGFEGDRVQEGRYAGRVALNGWKVARLPWIYPRDPRRLSLPAKEY